MMTPKFPRASIEAEGSVAEALRRAGRHFAYRALRALSSQAPTDSAVHEARKQLKRARTVLRLLRPALTTRIYRQENALFREVAHSLNAARDATVLTQTLDSLLQGHRALSRDAQVAQLRRTLRGELAEERRRLRGSSSDLVRARSTLGRTCERITQWRLGADDWLMLGPALKGIYKRGRRACPDSWPSPTSTTLHGWRKKAKYLRYALEIVLPMRPRKLGRLLRQGKQLTDLLGDARDLVMLEARIQSLRPPKHKGLARLLTMCKRRRTRLELKAMTSGEELFARRPRDFEAHLEEYWTRWRRTV